jgi:hypothetical protein
MNGFVSPRLGIRFDTSGAELVIARPDGERFLTFQELRDERDAEKARAEVAEREADRFRQMLWAAGIDPAESPG